eukprot:179058-Amphidinium_carterae.1
MLFVVLGSILLDGFWHLRVSCPIGRLACNLFHGSGLDDVLVGLFVQLGWYQGSAILVVGSGPFVAFLGSISAYVLCIYCCTEAPSQVVPDSSVDSLSVVQEEASQSREPLEKLPPSITIEEDKQSEGVEATSHGTHVATTAVTFI